MVGFLGTIAAVIGAVIGFIVCSKFRWFGSFTGIVGQYITFMFVGALIGMMLVGSIFGTSEKSSDDEDENAYYEEAGYSEDEDAYYEETDYSADGNGYDSNEVVEYDDKEEEDYNVDDEEENGEDVEWGNNMPELEDGGGALAGEYILAESSDVELTEEDLAGLTAQELTYARNEIYARHGYVFKSEELNGYFTGKVWYVPDETFDGALTGVEEVNASFISSYQDANGLTYKPR